MYNFLCSEAVLQRCSPTKTLYKYEVNTRKNERAEARSQQSRFVTLLKSHPCIDAPPRIYITPTKHLFPGEHLWETAPVCQNSFKDLNYKKLLFTTVKTNLLTLKNK